MKTKFATTLFCIYFLSRPNICFTQNGKSTIESLHKSSKVTELFFKNDFKQAKIEIDKLKKEYPQQAHIHSLESVLFSKVGLWEQSLKLLDYSYSLDPSRQNYHSYKGWIYLRAEKYDQAIEYFTKEIDLNQTDDLFLTFQNRGQAYMAQKKFKEAESDFNRSIKLAPPDFPIRTIASNKAELLYHQGKYDASLKMFTDIINAKGYADQYYSRSLVYVALKKENEALNDINKAIEFEPHRTEYYTQRIKVRKSINPSEDISDDEKTIKIQQEEMQRMKAILVESSTNAK